MRRLYYISILFLSACLAPDEKVEPPKEKSLFISQNLTEPFAFLDLVERSNSFNSSALNWHLKFQSEEGKWSVFLNPLVDISVYRTSETNFDTVKPSIIASGNLDWRYDVPVKNGVRSAIGQWGHFEFETPKSYKRVYILKIKKDVQLEFIKFQILDAVDDGYYIKYAKLGSDNVHEFPVAKSWYHVNEYLELGETPNFINVEPVNRNWQMCFTYNLDSLSNNPDQKMLRQVTDSVGIFPKIILNSESVKVLLDTTTAFKDIDYFYAKEQNYHTYDQIPNPFFYYNHQQQKYYVDDRVVLLSKVGDIFIKIRAENMIFQYPASFTLNLVAESL